MNSKEDNCLIPTPETRSLRLLRAYGFQHIQQLDWVAKNPDGQYSIIEVKEKELFTPGQNFPYYGAGLDKSQWYLRRQLLQDLGLRTYLLIFSKGTNDIYGAYLDELDKGEFLDTKRQIRIYPIGNFTPLKQPTIKNEGV